MFGSILGLCAVQPVVLGSPGSVNGGLPLVVVDLKLDQSLANPGISYRQDRLLVKGFVAGLISQFHHWKFCMVQAL